MLLGLQKLGRFRHIFSTQLSIGSSGTVPISFLLFVYPNGGRYSSDFDEIEFSLVDVVLRIADTWPISLHSCHSINPEGPVEQI